MHTINKLINRGLWIFGPPALAALFAIAANAAMKDDGIVIGHPKTTVVYVNAPQDARMSQLAAALPASAWRSK